MLSDRSGFNIQKGNEFLKASIMRAL